jgi:hypothetical protein
LYYLRDLRGKAAKIREKRDGIDGYGDEPYVPEVEEVAAPVAVEAPVEAVVETPAEVVEAPAAEVETPAEQA